MHDKPGAMRPADKGTGMPTVYAPERQKTDLVQDLIDLSQRAGHPLSVSRARKLAQKIRRGDFDPEFARVLAYADPTGEAATGFIATPSAQKWAPTTEKPQRAATHQGL